MSRQLEVSAEIHQFICDQFPLARKKSIDPSTELIEGGIIDSLGILEIVNFIESKYQIVLDDEEMVGDNFRSIESLSAFVVQKTGGTLSIDN